MALVVLALAIRIAVPQGFMIADATSGAGFPLVICTGHGPMASVHVSGGKGEHNKGKSDAPCAFAGIAAAPTPGFSVAAIGAAAFQVAEVDPPSYDLAPGRGLAAPPPPPRGPPAIL